VNKRLCFLFTVVTAVPVVLLGQEKSQAPAAPPANPITASEKGVYSFVSSAVIGAAQKMPEENYSFKPSPAEHDSTIVNSLLLTSVEGPPTLVCAAI
jgi:hypothetical protein